MIQLLSMGGFYFSSSFMRERFDYIC